MGDSPGSDILHERRARPPAVPASSAPIECDSASNVNAPGLVVRRLPHFRLHLAHVQHDVLRLPAEQVISTAPAKLRGDAPGCSSS